MSGPDRFDAQARELVCKVDGMTYGHSDDERAAIVAAALRAAESSALERATHVCSDAAEKIARGRPPDGCDTALYAALQVELMAESIRALIPPAAETAACTEMLLDHRCDEEGPHEQHRAENAGEGGADLVWTAAAPAAEARCPFDEQDCLDARQLLRECEEALSTVGCHPDGEALAQAVLKKLRARAAPTKEST